MYALLGGKTKDRLPVYCTTAKARLHLGYTLGCTSAAPRPHLGRTSAAPRPHLGCTSAAPRLHLGRPLQADVAKRHGFAGAKVPCPHGPAAGDEGFRANVAYFKAQREKVGPDFPLMLDCYMALTLPYTIRLAKAREREEPSEPASERSSTPSSRSDEARKGARAARAEVDRGATSAGRSPPADTSLLSHLSLSLRTRTHPPLPPRYPNPPSPTPTVPEPTLPSRSASLRTTTTGTRSCGRRQWMARGLSS